MSSTLSTLIAVCALAAVVVWFDWRCLTDLANTRDQDLRYLTRQAWALAIVVMFPLGPMIYLRYGKGPRRYG